MKEKKAQSSKSLGSAIDDLIAALEPLDEECRRIAVKAACERLRVELPQSVLKAGHPQSTPPEPAGARALTEPRQHAAIDIRSFASQKRPSTVNDRVALVAYYLSELAPDPERKDTIDKKDLEKYFKQARFPLPKRLGVALVHARHAGYLEPVAKGKYRLNPVGYNLVAHGLPRKHAEQPRKPRRGGKNRT